VTLQLLAEITGAGASFKFSHQGPNPELDVTLSFAIARRRFALDEPPTTGPQALVRWIFLEPCPCEVWLHLNAALEWHSRFEPFWEEVPSLLVRDPAQLAVPPSSQNLNREEVQALQALHPPVAGRAGGKVHLRIDDVLHRGVPSATGRQLARLLSRIDNGWEEVAVIGLVLLDQFSPPAGRIQQWLLQHPDALALPLKRWVKFCQVWHNCIRMTATFPALLDPCHVVPDVVGYEGARMLYGLETTVGRSTQLGGYAPVEEIRMRLADPSLRRIPRIAGGIGTWSSEASYDQALRRATQEALDASLDDTIELTTFTDWYAARMFWAASGGAPGATVTWDPSEKAERLSKRGALLLIPESHIRQILKRYAGAVLWSKFTKVRKRQTPRYLEHSR